MPDSSPHTEFETVRKALDLPVSSGFYRTYRDASDALTRIEEQIKAERREEWREGIVNVLDHEGNYLGCMGSETWAWTLDGGIERLKEQLEALQQEQENLRAAVPIYDRLRRTQEQLEAAQKAQHVQNLEWAISLAESDPLYAEVFRPYFQKIVDALASNPAKTPTPWDSAEFERNAEAVRRATDDSSPARKPYVRPADDPHTLVANALTPDPASRREYPNLDVAYGFTGEHNQDRDPAKGSNPANSDPATGVTGRVGDGFTTAPGGPSLGGTYPATSDYTDPDDPRNWQRDIEPDEPDPAREPDA